jgi:hypothetical protein
LALALRAIGYADVRFGILSSQSAFAGMTTRWSGGKLAYIGLHRNDDWLK